MDLQKSRVHGGSAQKEIRNVENRAARKAAQRVLDLAIFGKESDRKMTTFVIAKTREHSASATTKGKFFRRD